MSKTSQPTDFKMSFKDKVVIVTGGSSGIGAAAAIAFSAEGASVVIVGRNEAKLARTAEQCSNALVLRADITNDDQARRVIDQTVERYGKIDVLLNSAGGVIRKKIFEEDIMQAYDNTMKLNLRSVFLLTSLAIPYLIKTKGNIVTVSSIAGHTTRLSSDSIVYCISKAGLSHFGALIATDLAPYGVRVNTVSPGPVATDLLENCGLPNDWDGFKLMTALNKISDAAEISDLILFLAGDKAKSITGSNYFCDNGLMIKR